MSNGGEGERMNGRSVLHHALVRSPSFAVVEDEALALKNECACAIIRFRQHFTCNGRHVKYLATKTYGAGGKRVVMGRTACK